MLPTEPRIISAGPTIMNMASLERHDVSQCASVTVLIWTEADAVQLTRDPRTSVP